ncbi:MAG TPA: glycosyl transferase family 2 [Pasteurellaceae bacterium]|nr:glycosyl transferase family 2 [Pasteurellaceae bacterium]
MNSNSDHWVNQSERGSALALKFTRLIVKYCPLWLIKTVTFWVVVYFYLTSGKARTNILRYQQRLCRTFPGVGKLSVFRQFMAFGEALVDRFAVWQRKIRYIDLVADDSDHLYDDIRFKQKRGQILICSHFGNVEMCRAFADKHVHFHLNVLIHSWQTEEFNKALEQAGADKLALIQVENLNINVMLDLQQRIENGEWIAIAADRTPIRGSKTQKVMFLGDQAEFPQGAWLLAALLKAPLNTVFCLKENGRYKIKLRRFLPAISGEGKERQANIIIAMQKYADLLAQECAENPLLWFNFYNFWNDN